MALHIRTPLIESAQLSRALGSPVWVKLESLQPSGSFKLRGIGRVCELALAKGATRLVSSSGGNAGLAVAYAGKKLGMAVWVVVPQSTSAATRERMAREGAKVEVHGDVWDEADQLAQERAREPGSAYVHPFDEPELWSGHATMIEEVAEQGLSKPGAVVTSVGGGGLLCGILEGLHRVGWPDVPVLAVETEGAASFDAAIRAGRVVTLERISTIALTLGAKAVAQRALAWTHEHPVKTWKVTDRQALDACFRFVDDHRLLVEPSCGATLAAIYGRAEPLKGASSVLAIACGGAGVDLKQLSAWDNALRSATGS